MKSAFALVFCTAASVAFAADAPPADVSKQVTPQEIVWEAGPPSLPPGAQRAVLYGDPGKAGPFALRLKFPDGYRVPPHTHPGTEVVTVISGVFKFGMGEKGDKAKTKDFPAGSFVVVEPGMAHYAFAGGETVVQINSIGPWAVNYVNPADDPR